MKQLDFETSNYKHKDQIKTFVDGFNEMVDKYVKSFENADADLKKTNTSIEKKNRALNNLDVTLADLNKKTDEFKSLKEVSNEEIKALESKKGEIAFTDSEVQKMELEDINAQISAKKGKISKIDSKLDSTKAKIKTSNEERKACEKELKELDKQRLTEEEALFRTQAIITLVSETKDMINTQVIDIINTPYKPKVEEPEVIIEAEGESVEKIEELGEEKPSEKVDLGITEEELSVLDLDKIEDIPVIEETNKEPIVPSLDDLKDLDIDVDFTSESKETEEEEDSSQDSATLREIFKKEDLDFNSFASNVREKMISNIDGVIKNIEILKKHNVPLEYVMDQSQILYDISSQDLDDLLSIITTDEDGNGMGFAIDYTFNILSELSKINVDKLIDVYNSEFMNVNAKSGIIHLLKLTNPDLTDFEKNRRTNIEILKSLGTDTVDDIINKYPDFVNMDNPLFINVLNVFDKNDLVEKLNNDVDVIPKIIEYWKNN